MLVLLVCDFLVLVETQVIVMGGNFFLWHAEALIGAEPLAFRAITLAPPGQHIWKIVLSVFGPREFA